MTRQPLGARILEATVLVDLEREPNRQTRRRHRDDSAIRRRAHLNVHFHFHFHRWCRMTFSPVNLAGWRSIGSVGVLGARAARWLRERCRNSGDRRQACLALRELFRKADGHQQRISAARRFDGRRENVAGVRLTGPRTIMAALMTDTLPPTPPTAAPTPSSDEAPARTPYPFNFSILRETGKDPVLGKTIKLLIAADDHYIVYVDEDNFVEWTMNDNKLLAGCGSLITRVGALEAADCKDLTQTQLDTYKRLIGESVARMFEGDLESATAALDTAERWISARSQESARIWSLQGATVMMIALVGAFIAAYIAWDRRMTAGPASIAAGSFLGALGAFLSVMQRSGVATIDPGAGSNIYWLDGVIRILTGAVSGFFVGLLVQSGHVFPVVAGNPTLFFAVCLVSGLSERMVNALAGALEGKIAPQPRTAATTTPIDVAER